MAEAEKNTRAKLLGCLGMGYFVNSAQELSLPQLFPAMQQSFPTPLANSAVTDIDSARVFTQTLLTPLWGLLADRFSRKWVLVIGTGLWGGLGILCGLSQNYWQLLIAWTVSLIGLGALVPAGFSMLADCYPPSERGKAIGILNAIGMAGIILFGLACNPFLGMFGPSGWRIIFFALGGLSIGSGLMLAIFLKETARGAAEPELADVNVELLAAKFRFRLVDIFEILRSKTIWVAYIQGFFMLSSLYILLRLFTVWLVRDRMFEEENAPVVFGLIVSALAIGSVIGGFVSDWADRRWPHHGRPAISQVSLILIVPSVIVLITCAFSTGAILAISSFIALFIDWTRRCTIQPIIQNVLRPELRGTALALAEFTTGGLASFMVVFFGRCADVYGLSWAFLLGTAGNAAMAFLVAFAYYRVYPPEITRLRKQMSERRLMLSGKIQNNV
ncbi:MAG TPA: MFS transporter [Candidatus Hydrogenedentes bacterium]|nr:MFS transporter [Candidatus Hydrogenedentota bacterium]